MTRWLVSVPVWGERCVDVFCATALPALELSMSFFQSVREDFGDEAVLVVHTDQPQRVEQSATLVRVEPRPVPSGLRDFDCLSQAHREVLGMACRDDVVVLLTADLVISGCGIAYCADALDNRQKRLVLCAGVRALQEGPIPTTAEAQSLMSWAWENRHPITEACRWPEGRSADLSRIYFEAGGAVRTRLALPHPLAVRIDGRPLKFSPTIDANLMQNFDETELHLVRDCSELALVELSPRDKDFRVSDESMEDHVSKTQTRLTDPLQRWCFSQPVRLRGPGANCGDGDVAAVMLREPDE